MPLLVHAVIGTLGVHGEAIQLPREPRGKVTDVDHLLHFALALGTDLSHFQGHERAQLPLFLAQAIAQLTNYLTAFGGGQLAPFQERGVRAANDRVVIVLGDLSHFGDQSAIGRAMNLQQVP